MNKKNIITPTAFIFAAVFLFNPNINIIDFLPDFIGYFIIYNALSKVADLIPHFDDARDRFHKLFWITLSKIPAMFIMASISSQNTAERPIIAVFSLAYAILELIYIYPAFSALFEGFEYLEERFGVEETKKHKILLPPAKFTAVFFSIKMICCTVPEFSLTSVSDMLGDVTYKPNIANFYPYFAVLGAFIAIIFGAIWLFKFSRFVRYIARSRHIEFSLSSSYMEKQSRLRQIYSYRFVCLAMSLITFATLFGVDLFVDNKNILPDIFSGLLFIAAAIVMRRFTKSANLSIVFGIIYCVSTVCTTFALESFHSEYIYEDIPMIAAAEHAYDLVVMSSALECVLSAVLFFSIASCVASLVKEGTGSPNLTESAVSSNEKLHRSFKMQAFVTAAIGVIASVSTVVYTYMLAETEEIKMLPEYSADPLVVSKYGELWIMVAILSFIWLIFTYRLSHMIKESAESRFEIERD